MVTNRWKYISWPVLVTALASPALIDCAGMPGLPSGIPGADKLGDVANLAKGCPDTASVEAIAKVDWASEFKLDASASGKLKGGLSAAVSLQGIAASIDADLKLACGNLAKDLGATGEFKSGQESCKAAIKAMGDLKAKMGAKATIALDVKAPTCSASVDAMADCAGKCDASVSGGKAKVECKGGELSGKCEGKCQGACDLSASAACGGTCGGSCDAGFSGTCSGTCDGKCDGKNTKGECKGKCEGKCDAGGSGSCTGKCGGSCKVEAGAKCEGTCHAKCDVDFKAPACSGQLEMPKVSADCKASCDAQVSGKLSCTPAGVSLKIDGAADAAAAAKYKAALEANLPAVLKVAIGMKDRAASLATNVTLAVDGAQAAVKASVSGGPAITTKLLACVAMPFKGAIDAAASIKANVNVSVDVKASASASGSASGKAG